MNKFLYLTFLIFISNFVFGQTITTSNIVGAPFCQNTALNVPYTITGAYNPGNIFTAELSDENGNFGAPTVIGTLNATVAGTINANLPNLMTSGTQYRIRVVSSDPVVVGTDNGLDLTINGNPNDPSTFGNNIWHAYCFNIAAYTNNAALFNYSNYRGMYTENTLNVNSSNFWGVNSNPSTAAGYVGCPVTNNLHTVNYKRRGFPCGYYNISVAGPGNIAGHDDAGRLLVDGVVVWSSTGCCAAIPNVYTGFLGPNTEIEFVWSENGGQSYGRLTFNSIPFPSVSPDVVICAGSNTTLTASGAANYDWSTNATHLIAPLNNATVDVAPPGGTPNSVETYTVSTTDALTGCTVSNTVDVTIDPLPATSVTPTTASYCAAGSVNAIASGANTYTWSPVAGVTVNSPSGNDVTLSPASTTVYTVTGSNNCATVDATVTVTVNVPMGDPNDFGVNTWNVYCYNGNNFNTFFGMYVHNTLDFDTRTIWGNNSTPSNAPGYTGCPIPVDQHSYRYKRRGFDCGYYQLDIPNHDDQVNLIIDGVSVFSQNNWFQNIYKADVWRGYLDADSEIEYTVREGTGGSNGGLAFIYLHGPNNSPNETVWSGRVSNDWFNPANWCSVVPTNTIDAFIPYNVDNNPEINGVGAVCNNLFIQEAANLSIVGSNGLDIYGGIDKQGTFTPNNGVVNVLGTNPIIFNSSNSNLTFYDLNLNNSNVNALTLNSLNNNKITVSNSLNFNQGIIFTGGTNFVEFADNAIAIGTKDISYINGPVRKIGNDAFNFPVGKGGFYRPISISAPSNAADHFTAEFFDLEPDAVDLQDPAPIDVGITNISDCEHWILDRTNGASNVNVTLSYRPYGANGCSGVADLSALTIVRWDGATWVNHPGTAVGNPSGSITTNAPVTSFSPFALATTSNSNPLPIELVSFTAKANGNQVDLEWQTASEINNDFFTIERSKDGTEFEVVTTVKGAGNSSALLNYKTEDTNPYSGTSFYRLKQTDFDGAFEYSEVRKIEIEGDGYVFIYPNPVLGSDERFIVDVSGFQNGVDEIIILDALGKIVYSKSENLIGQIDIETSILNSGIYFVRVVVGANLYHKKVVVK